MKKALESAEKKLAEKQDEEEQQAKEEEEALKKADGRMAGWRDPLKKGKMDTGPGPPPESPCS